MQSKTSFFNGTVFKKNITRFSPIWLLTSLGMLLLLMLTGVSDPVDPLKFYQVSNFSRFIQQAALFLFVYAMVCAQAVFGDLFNSRSCYALHALPLRREGMYLSNMLSGFLFALIPGLIFALASLFVTTGSCVEGGWMISFYMLAACFLMFLFFYGVAVVCSLLAGNRLGMLLLYLMVNGIVAVGGLLVEAVYLDLLNGVYLVSDRYLIYSPVFYLCQNPMLTFDFDGAASYWSQMTQVDKGLLAQEQVRVTYTLNGEIWQYYGILALIGLALLAVGVVLYRRRSLESAGDILAFPKLRLLFLVPLSFCAGAFAQEVYASFANDGDNGFFMFLIVGLLLGWFSGQMMLERSLKVFRKGTILQAGAMVCVMALTLGITYLDPMKVQSWVPDPGAYASVTVDGVKIENPQEQAKLMELHQLSLENALPRDYNLLPGDLESNFAYRLEYTKSNGTPVLRRYRIRVNSQEGQLLKHFLSSPQAILGDYKPEDFNQGQVTSMEEAKISQDQIKSLWAAIAADCAEENMARDMQFHNGTFQQVERREYIPYPKDSYIGSLDLRLSGIKDDNRWNHYITIYADATHTVQWLQDNGILDLLGIAVVPDQAPSWGMPETQQLTD